MFPLAKEGIVYQQKKHCFAYRGNLSRDFKDNGKHNSKFPNRHNPNPQSLSSQSPSSKPYSHLSPTPL